MANEEGRDRLKIELTARRDFVPLDSFLRVVSSALDILKDIDIQMAENHRRGSRWKVAAASLQSPLSLTVVGQDQNPLRVSEITKAYLYGIEMIENDATERPPYFSDQALQKAKQIVSVLNDGVTRVQFSVLGKTVTPTQKLAAHVDAMNVPVYSAYGSFEGKLETLSVHGGTQFMLYDRLNGDPVQCLFDTQYLDDAKSAFTKRVRVYGLIRYRRDGRAKAINVDGPIQLLRDRSELPQAKDIEGVDITGGIDSAEYVRHLRDDE